MADAGFDPDAILDALLAHSVEFVVVGGVAAAVHGAGWTTFDLDIVIATHEEISSAWPQRSASCNPSTRHSTHAGSNRTSIAFAP
jgi:hypothetical protein